ncbi:MAG: hypothetical protein U0169_17130 [Polyangiaceae bacterium]
MTAVRKGATFVAFALASACPGTVAASPEVSTGVTTGFALDGLRAGSVKPAFALGLRADVLFFREKPRETAFGPYLEVGTLAFDRVDFGGGVSWLVPGMELPFVLSAGAFARGDRVGASPGVVGNLAWGSRSYNFHARYGMTYGLFAEARATFAPANGLEAVFGVRIDAMAFALPFVFLVEAVRH